MSVSNTQNQPLISSFAGVGTIAGGTVGYNAINKHYDKIADKTVQMFNGTLQKPDRFLKQNSELLSQAANSKRGFFGKINKVIGNNNSNASWLEKIEQGASQVVGGYRAKAAKAFTNTDLTGEALEKSVQEATNSKISEGIAKSIKSVSKNKTLAVVLGCAVAGTLLFNAITKGGKKPKKVQAQEPQTVKKGKARAVKDSKKIKNEKVA